MASPGKPRGTTCARARAKACAATFSPGLRVRLMPGPPLRGKTRQGKACRAWFGHVPRGATSLSSALPHAYDGAGRKRSAAPLTHSGAGHELALPPQAAPSPTLPRQARTMKKLFGASRRRSASTRLLSQLLPITIPGNTRRTAAARRFPRHLSRFLRSPWTAFSFLA